MQVHFKVLATGRTITLSLEPSDTVDGAKQRLADLEGVPADAQRLIFRGKQLQPGTTLADAGLHKDATVHLVLRLSPAFLEITVWTMSGKSVTLDVAPATSIGGLKGQAGEALGLPAERHSLNFSGRRLAEVQTMADLKIPTKSTLRMIRQVECYSEPAPAPSAAPARGSLGSPMCGFSSGDQAPSGDQDRLQAYGEPGTLYARCGGIFGVAGFVDRCMDKWMADPMLNANPAVATWHARAQRCGFKFLVTELMGCLAGGPQRYTGKPMAHTHKHLGITSPEWGSFMGLFGEVCNEFALPEEMTGDLVAVLSSLEEDCVLRQGEVAPPKPSDAPLVGPSLYARLGGVYPLALFADRLVDALLGDRRVQLAVDGQRRNEASLKYLFTELVCSATGGPEVLTSEGCTETRLLLPGRKMFFLLDAAKAASNHFGCNALRRELIMRLHEVQHLIVDPLREVKVTVELRARQAEISRVGQQTGVPLIYIPKGGVVKLDFGATREQLERVNRELAELGLKTVEKTAVKSADDAAAGRMLSSATIAARYAAPGAFVAARKRVFGEPSTLYGRGGGVFGLAKLADRLMEVWMSDPQLNANDKVARWHQSEQKCGFKFLVTQIFGYLTGGPQRYTGKPMDVAHKHLGIDLCQWQSFMGGADQVFQEFRIDPQTQKELRSIFTSLRDQVIVQKGEAVPADPGLCRQPPAGTTLYAQAGGIYPLAQFADALVELVLRGDRVQVDWDGADASAGRRTPPGLKYLVTELCCSGAGGPEIVTSRGLDEAKLGVPGKQWPAFLNVAAEAAAGIWAEPVIRGAVLATLEEQKAELCAGLAAEDASAAAVARRRLREAGFGQVETTAALLRCQGDADRALELLISGWAPEQLAAPPPEALRCPFSGASGAPGGSACPAAARSGGAAAALLPVPAASAPAAVAPAGRLLESRLQSELDELLSEEPELVCPITLVLLCSPVIASDGCVYERAAVTELIRVGVVSPMTHQRLADQLFPAEELKRKVRDFIESRGQELLRFSRVALKQGEKGLASAALDRAADYVALLVAETGTASGFLSWVVGSGTDGMKQELEDLCRQAGKAPPALSAPHARMERVLPHRIQQIKAELHVDVGSGDDGMKSVAFCIDVSGSMSGPRIQAARENLLKIFDQYVEDEDLLCLITFATQCRTEVALQEVGPRRAQLRHTAVASLRTRDQTAFYDALVASAGSLRASPPHSKQWIIALTDGGDNKSKNSLESALRQIRASPGKPDLIIVGIQLDGSVRPRMVQLAAATQASLFIDARDHLGGLDEAFEKVAELICE